MSHIGITGIPVYQNGQDFIIGKATVREVLEYTRYTERLIVGYDEEGRPLYNKNVQRKVDNSRAKKIADFLIFDDSPTFPTNIILNIPQNVIEAQDQIPGGLLHIGFKDTVIEQTKKAKEEGPNNADIFISIIDGQHRLRGIELAIDRLEEYIDEDYKGKKQEWRSKLDGLYNMELVISCFIDKTLEYQAMIFSTINRTQKRVSQDLVYSLFGLTTSDSPYKTALEIVLALNGHKGSPFYNRIKLYGGTYDSRMSPPLSQATMVKSIVSLISANSAEAERNRYMKRKELKKCTSTKNLPFRQYYANDEDNKIANCMYYFFSSVRKYFPQAWEYNGLSKPSNILQSTVGYNALMNIMADILKMDSSIEFYLGSFDPYMERIKDINVLDIKTYPMTNVGKKVFYDTMFINMFPDDPTSGDKQEEITRLTRNMSD